MGLSIGDRSICVFACFLSNRKSRRAERQHANAMHDQHCPQRSESAHRPYKFEWHDDHLYVYIYIYMKIQKWLAFPVYDRELELEEKETSGVG